MDGGFRPDMRATLAPRRKQKGVIALPYGTAPDIEHWEESTSTRLSALMRRVRLARQDEDLLGAVELVPTLSYGFGEWSVRFKIACPEGSYELKGISDFLQRMRTGERFAYGKRLAFAHIPEMLTERSRAIGRMLAHAETARRKRDRWTGEPLPGGIGRDLALSQGELIELLDALEGGTVDVKASDPRTPALAHAQVGAAEPGFRISLEMTEGGGCRVEVPEEARLVRSGSRMYVWRGDSFFKCPASWAPCAEFLGIALDPETRPPFIAHDDLPLFCATLLPIIEQALPVDIPPEIEALKPLPCTLRFYFDRKRGAVLCEARAAYGDEELRVGTDDAQGNGGTTRDVKREAKAEELVERYFGGGWLPAAARLPLDDEEGVAKLLLGGLAEFRALGEVHVTPAFERLLRDKSVRITFGVAVAHGLLNLTVSADDLPPAELAALLASYRKRKRYHRLRDGAFVDLAECDLAQLDRIARDLGVTQAQLASGNVELPSFRAFYLDEEADLERDRSFDRYLERFHAVNEDAYAVPRTLEDVLRPYQADGFRWLSARCDAGFGGILADEMGLGKSLQVIALLLAQRETMGMQEAAAEPTGAAAAEPADAGAGAGPALIVCPASLVYNWIAECARFAPELRVRALAGSKQERTRLLALAPNADAADSAGGDGAAASATREGRSENPTAPCPYDVLVTSYDTLRVDVDAIAARSFGCCILDEAQYIKNPATRITRAAKRIRARHRFALTGTPMENRLSDLWSIFDFLMPGILGPYARFRERFELAIAGGDEDAAARLRRLVGPFMLRRRKEDVLADLPEKLESIVYVSLEGEQRDLYSAHEQQLRERLTEQKRVKGGKGRAVPTTPEARAAAATAVAAGDDFTKRRVEILAEITKLRQICCDPALLYENYAGPAAKLQVIADLVESAHDAGEKVLVFSQFTGFLSLIAEQLDARKIAHYAITGATPKRRRLQLVDAFNSDDVPAFLISLKAGGTGLNLTGASVVIHADPWWNMAAQDQATDRTHRIGQTRTVTVQKVIAKDTIEERILNLQEAKAFLADQVIGASGTSLAGLTREDLLELLG